MKVSLQRIQKWPWLVAGLAFLTLLFLFPSPYFVTPNLDSSWQAVLEEAFFKQWQFGKDIIFTGGPLNFLYSPTSNGYYPFLQVFAEALVLFLALFFLFSTLRSQPNWVHATLFIVLFCAAASGKDGIFLCSLGAVSLRLLRGDLKIYRGGRPLWICGRPQPDEIQLRADGIQLHGPPLPVSPLAK